MGGFFAFLLSRATGISAFAILEAGYLLFGLVGLSVVAGGTARELAGRPERRRYLIVLVAGLPLGLVGARLIPVIQDAVAAGRLTWGLVTSGGLVFYGGALVWLAAMNPAQQLFGSTRLLALLAAQAGRNPEALDEAVMQAVRDFAGEAPQADDITVLSLLFRGSEPG